MRWASRRRPVRWGRAFRPLSAWPWPNALAARYGDALVDHYTYVIAGDGCLQEGISHEAIDLAGHLKLGRLIVFWDHNSISIDGPTSLSTSWTSRRSCAAGWQVFEVDGHDVDAVADAIEQAQVREACARCP